jgi:hypothetical protein
LHGSENIKVYIESKDKASEKQTREQGSNYDPKIDAATWRSIFRVSMPFSFNHLCFNYPYFNGFPVSKAGTFNTHTYVSTTILYVQYMRVGLLKNFAT